MRNPFIILFLFSLAFVSCNKSDENTDDPPLSTWKLTAIRQDVGAPSPFQSVTSNRTIKFFSNGNFLSNGDICELTTSSDLSVFGAYSLQDSTLAYCNNDLIYYIIGNELIIEYPCIEACQAKYTKQ